MDVGLHDHGEEGLVDPAAAFQQAREEAARAELGYYQVDGIALALCTADTMVAVRTGGEWDEAEELVLGQPLDGFQDALQTLEDLLHMLLGQTADERLEYQHDGSADAVRATVTTADGEVTMIAERHRHDQPTGPEPLIC
ncbi:hypothetical protein AB0M29_31210 [Streptomyces sp. NPDC051976]|uniref:hypothetical protein n=1 Tax=Streptomyces sp. NPDC051976 TaxID=3154947 RepID=UPI00344A59A5